MTARPEADREGPEADQKGCADLRGIADLFDLVGASSRSARQRERLARASGLTVTGANLAALRIVDRHGPLSLTEVARRLNLDQSTASRQVRPLEEHGLVERNADPSDRRSAPLNVTADGRAVLDRVRAVMINDIEVALTGWTADDRRTLVALVERLRLGLLSNRVDESGWSVAQDPL